MARSPKAIIEPAILVWARTSAGVTIEDAAKYVGTTLAKIEAWEADEDKPTINQLYKLAEKYKRPISVFYLSKPPKDFQALQDFRRVADVLAAPPSSGLAYEIRASHERRLLALDLYQELGQTPITFRFHARRDEAASHVAARLRELFGIGAETQATWRAARLAYNAWRAAVEKQGILVFQVSGIDLSEMRGIAIAQHPLPVVAINSRDSYTGRSFSLMHEVAHVALRQSGISDFNSFTDDHGRAPETQQLEIFCNQIAAAVLMPEADMLANPLVIANKGHPNWSDDDITTLANNFGVSSEAALRRLLTLQRTTQAYYRHKRAEYLARYAREAERKTKGGPEQPVKALARVGGSFARLLLQTYYEKRITLSELSGYLNLKVPYISEFETVAYARNS